jgi:hypothetical protein
MAQFTKSKTATALAKNRFNMPAPFNKVGNKNEECEERRVISMQRAKNKKAPLRDHEAATTSTTAQLLTLTSKAPLPLCKKRENGLITQAGLLTCSLGCREQCGLTSQLAFAYAKPSPRNESDLSAPRFFAAHSCGTVADSHGIPYSSRMRFFPAHAEHLCHFQYIKKM